MNATDTKYNPFRAAVAVAFAELSSESAHRYYSLKAQEDIQTVLDASVTIFAWFFQLAQLTYTMGIQCRAWCDELETSAQATSLAMPMLATVLEEVEDPWEVEADYEFVEFSPSVAAQAFVSSMLLLAPPASNVVCGAAWNQTPKEINTEAERLLELQCVPAPPLPAPRARSRAQGRPEAMAEVVDELATALNVPGATGGKRKPRAKASTSKAAAAKPKEARARAGAKGGK